jgi:hypothetical protein
MTSYQFYGGYETSNEMSYMYHELNKTGLNGSAVYQAVTQPFARNDKNNVKILLRIVER